MRIIWHFLLFMIFYIGSTTILGASEAPVFLGVIEPSPTHYSGEVSTKPFAVRAVFKWNGGSWNAFPCTPRTPEDLKNCSAMFPEHVTWTIAFNGKNGEQFSAGRPSKWEFYSDVGLLRPDSSEHVHLIKKGAKDFVYWSYPWPFRPLVVISKPIVGDPDHWKESRVSSNVLRRLIPFFHKAVKSVSLSCENKMIENYSDQLIQRRKSYKSDAGALLVQLALSDSSVRNCDGPREEEFDSRWFYVNGDTVRFVGQSLELIDAGDYDEDGHSEVVFHKSGYNYDGYVLLYNQLQNEVEFGWNYH